MKIGDRIRYIRKQKKIKLWLVASKIGISNPALSKIEKGITNVNLSRLGDIADVLGIPLVSLLADDFVEFDNYELRMLTQKLNQKENEIRELQDKAEELFTLIHARSKSKNPSA